jgi:hypothetical protein
LILHRSVHRPWLHFTDEARKEQTSDTRSESLSMTSISA